jgi:hypothetical protein
VVAHCFASHATTVLQAKSRLKMSDLNGAAAGPDRSWLAPRRFVDKEDPLPLVPQDSTDGSVVLVQPLACGMMNPGAKGILACDVSGALSHILGCNS